MLATGNLSPMSLSIIIAKSPGTSKEFHLPPSIANNKVTPGMGGGDSISMK